MVELKVADARQRDAARGIGRIDQSTMQKLGISAGDVIEIVSKRSTAAIAWPAYQEDQDKGIIRIDGLTRKNAEAKLNELVMIRPAEVENASHITLEPMGMRINVDEDFIKFAKNRLMERVFVEGDQTLVAILGHPVRFMVTKAIPDGMVRMAHDTELQVKSGHPGKEALENRLPRVKGIALRPFRMGKRDNTVMTRLSDEDLKQIDILIGIGIFDSRSEAVAYLTHEGITAKREMFEQLSNKFEEINKIRDEAKALLETSAPISNLKVCPKCGKQNNPESKFCSNCGQKLQ